MNSKAYSRSTKKLKELKMMNDDRFINTVMGALGFMFIGCLAILIIVAV